LTAIIALDNTLQTGKREIAQAEQSGSLMLKGLMTARVTQQVRSMITPRMMQDVMALMNTPLGFRTDRDPARGSKSAPYGADVVKDVIIAALMDDARLVGNEFNIISGQYYRTKEQLERKVREYPGLREFRYALGVPITQSGGALVSAWASWKLDGAADRIDCAQKDGFDSRIPVRVNEGQGADAILGKATRKLLYRVLKRLSGNDLGDPDSEADDDAAAGNTVDAVYTVSGVESPVDPQEPPTDETGDPTPVEAFRQRFAEAATTDQADAVLGDALSEELDEDATKLVREWHAEAIKRLTPRESPLDAIRQRMETATDKREVEAAYQAGARLQGVSNDDTKLLYRWRAEHMQRIHQSRGERSNKQKTLSES